jgi:exopolysaccharide biosynthesis polyprenyl glycosylphosphotransferase
MNNAKKILTKFQNSIVFFLSLFTYVSLMGLFFWIFSYAYPDIIKATRDAAVSSITFFITFLFMLNAYGGLDVGEKRTRQIVYSMMIVVFFADIFTYLVIQITNPTIWNIWQFGFFSLRRLLFAYVVQVLFIIAMSYISNRVYYFLNPPLKTYVIYGSNKRPTKLIHKLQKQIYKYRINLVTSDNDKDQVFKEILNNDVIVLYNILKEDRIVFTEFCYKYKKTVLFNAEIMDVVEFRSRHTLIDDISLFSTNINDFSIEDRILKRLLDIIVSLVGLILTSPFWLVFAILIYREDKGPIFFTQKRMTKNNREFNIIKFRTMKVNVENRSATKNDDRITKVGQFLRKIRMDELPQILNILIGDMSVVGPRPEMLENVEAYTKEMPEFELRLRVKAGLTGYAQIFGKYNTTPKDKLILDLMYIENYSIFLDIKLILQTVMVFLKIDDSTEGFDEEDDTH